MTQPAANIGLIGPQDFLKHAGVAVEALGEGASRAFESSGFQALDGLDSGLEIDCLIAGGVEYSDDGVARLERFFEARPAIKAYLFHDQNHPLPDPDPFARFGARVKWGLIYDDASECSGLIHGYLKQNTIAAEHRYVPFTSEIQVEFNKDGVYLFVDPNKVRRVQGIAREKMTRDQLRGVKIFMARVIDRLAELKVSQVDATAVSFVVSTAIMKPVKIAPAQEQSRDGEFEFELTEDKLYVRLTPPRGGGAPVQKDRLLKEAREKISNRPWFFFADGLDQFLEKKDCGETVFLLAEKRDASFALEMSADRLEVYMTLEAAHGGEPIMPGAVLRELRGMNVVYGINESVILDMIRIGVYGQKTIVAQGKRPECGKDGRYVPCWDSAEGKAEEEPEEAAEPENHEGGRVDLRQVSQIKTVEKGRKIVEIVQPEPGKEGIDLFGKKIQPQHGRSISVLPHSVGLAKADDEFTLLFGEGTELNEHWTAVVSSICGQPLLSNGVVCVLPLFEVDGDVNYEVGNIDFHGTVIVKGAVLSKFHVRAGGSIVVRGIVEDAILEAGADIVLEQGIVGNERAILFARRNITAKSIHQSNAFAFGEILVEDAVYHSRLICYENIVVGKTPETGQLVGGTSKAAKVISAAELGGVNFTQTRLEVGKNPWIKEEIEALREAYVTSRNIASKSIDLYRLRRKKEDLSKTLQTEVTRLPTSESSVEGAMHKVFLEWIDRFMEVELDSLSPPDIQYRNRFLKIIGRGKIYPGVTAVIRDEAENVDQPLVTTALTPTGAVPYVEGAAEPAGEKKRRRREKGP